MGIVGYLYIAGEGVGRGYLNMPAKTAAHFVTDPFSGGRMYLTGDKGRYHHNGGIEFIGRQDFMVKIRGLRVELGEIESVLVAHRQVTQAVVMVQQDEGNNERVVA